MQQLSKIVLELQHDLCVFCRIRKQDAQSFLATACHSWTEPRKGWMVGERICKFARYLQAQVEVAVRHTDMIEVLKTAPNLKFVLQPDESFA